MGALKRCDTSMNLARLEVEQQERGAERECAPVTPLCTFIEVTLTASVNQNVRQARVTGTSLL